MPLTNDSERNRYGFQGRLSAAFPSQILVDASELCNLACVHCPHPAFKKSEHYAGRLLDPTLNEKMVEEVREHGQGITQYIRYASNGEPLSHPHIFDMMDYAKRRSGALVTLTTNGKVMTTPKIERIVDIGVDVVDISIDAFLPETYARIRVHGDLAVTRRNVLDLIERSRAGGGGTKVIVSYVEQPTNAAETKDFESFWRDAGAQYVVIRRMHSCSGAMTDLADERRTALAKEQRRPCLYPWERAVINAAGELSFCPSDWKHGSRIADYHTTTIHETWGGAFYQGLRNAHLTNDYAGYGFCGQCPDWSATRWPNEGRSYADMIEEFKERE
jgi:sulfatase maturation enzyme AslB (radical SAM superfamily)